LVDALQLKFTSGSIESARVANPRARRAEPSGVDNSNRALNHCLAIGVNFCGKKELYGNKVVRDGQVLTQLEQIWWITTM